MQLYRAGTHWWPDSEFERAHVQREQDARFEADAWEEAIAAFLANESSTTVKQVAHGALSMETQRLGTADQRRITAAMERLGPTLDWSDWIVAVYDEIGNQHCVIAFSDAQALAPPQITGPECARRRQTVRKAGRTGRGLAKPNAGRRVSAGRQPRAS